MNRCTLYFDDNQTEEICKLAVQQFGGALKYVENQTEEICCLAVQQFGYALKYVKNQTEEICCLAVQQYGWALEYVKNQTEKICCLAVQENVRALEYVKEQTEEICKSAVQHDGRALQLVKNQTEEICKLAVQQNGDALYFVKEQTEEICKLAVQQTYRALEDVKDEFKTYELCELAILDDERENGPDSVEEKTTNNINPKYNPYLNFYNRHTTSEFVKDIIRTSYKNIESRSIESIGSKILSTKLIISKKKHISDLPLDILEEISTYLIPPIYKFYKNINISLFKTFRKDIWSDIYERKLYNKSFDIVDFSDCPHFECPYAEYVIDDDNDYENDDNDDDTYKLHIYCGSFNKHKCKGKNKISDLIEFDNETSLLDIKLIALELFKLKYN